MPPSRRSSSSRSSSSRSRSSSSSRRSSSSSRSYSSGPSRRSSSSYRSSSYRGRSYGSHSYGSGSSGSTYGRHSYGSSFSGDSYNGGYSDYDGYSLKDALEEIFDYVPREVVGDSYIDSYDEGRYFSGREYGNKITVEKKPDEPQKVHYLCEFCNSELEEIWKEGYYPTCKNCGAQMTKKTKVSTQSGVVSQGTDTVSPMKRLLKKKMLSIPILILLAGLFPQIMFGFQACVIQDALSEKEEYVVEEETNLQIYGTDIYLDDVDDNTYRICSDIDLYAKRIRWDYGIKAYYDEESNCYLWYNTDVSPNVWQYWYDDIAGDNYYGWMEFYNDKWYIEISDTEWVEYTGDTSDLWHIEE